MRWQVGSIAAQRVSMLLTRCVADTLCNARDKGPNLCHVTACSTGANAIADAFRLIRDGSADIMVVCCLIIVVVVHVIFTHRVGALGWWYRVLHHTIDTCWLCSVAQHIA
jgi:hypothetical protein